MLFRSQAAPEPSKEAADELADRIVGPDLGQNERDHNLGAKPEIFIQTRYSVAPIEGSGAAFDPNFRISRAEARWAGKIADRIGAGLEIQYQEAPDGTPDRLLNDAFLEYYFNAHTTVRAGQFVKPFGFDVEQASSVRESPERAIFSGYFFPGERDRGVMLSGDLGFLSAVFYRCVQRQSLLQRQQPSGELHGAGAQAPRQEVRGRRFHAAWKASPAPRSIG